MRHRIIGRRLGRTTSHRLALRRNMIASLFEHETISTTIEKAKEVKPFAEKLITLAKRGNLSARRQAISMLGNRNIVSDEKGKVAKTGTVIGKLFSEIGPRYLDRAGGYTRIVRLSMRRLGDNGQLVLLQLLGENEKVEAKTKKVSSKKAKPKGKKKIDTAGKTAEAVEEVKEAPIAEVEQAETAAVQE